MVGICTGTPDADTDLVSEVIREEPMVIVPSGFAPLDYSAGEPLSVITIESRSGAWASIEDDMERLHLTRAVSLESFFAVAQMAIAGFGHGLVPAGVAATLGVAREQCIPLAEHGLTRPVRFVARKSMFAQDLVRSFYAEVSRLADSM